MSLIFPRSILVTRCMRHMPFLEAVTAHAVECALCKTSTSFIAVLLTEVISTHHLTQPQLATLLPLLRSALSVKASLEFQVNNPTYTQRERNPT